MQAGGTLKKRRKRNLAKVNGLGVVPYDETRDTFRGLDLFGGADDKQQLLKSFVAKTGNDTRLSFSSQSMLDYRRDSYNSQLGNVRVTRNPNYHADVLDEVDEDLERSELRSSHSRYDRKPDVDENVLKERSHFLDKYSMQRLRQLIWLGITTGSFPWRWSEKEHRIERWGPTMEKLWWIQWFFVSIQTSLLTIFQLYAFMKSFKAGDHKKNGYRAVFQGSFSFLWYSYAVMCNINFFFYKEKTRVYINTLLRFNKEYVKKYLIHLDDFKDGGRMVINLAVITNITQVFVSVSLFLTMPYQPWYLFSYIYPKPWYWLPPFAFQEFMVIGQVITSYMLLSWVVVAHANTAGFWLREIHNNNDSDYTSDELRTPKRAVETYRSLEILGKCFNECMAPMAIPVVKIIMGTAMVPCGYVLIRSMDHKFIDEFPGILTYPLGVVDCATAGFVIMSMGAEVFDLGCSCVDSWSRTRQKDFRRILMSCPTLKMWVGRFYFITLPTTITFFKVVFDLITDCIITFP